MVQELGEGGSSCEVHAPPVRGQGGSCGHLLVVPAALNKMVMTLSCSEDSIPHTANDDSSNCC